jgi:hypothetical protein
MIDAYIDRIKSVAFTGFIALALGIAVAYSRDGLSHAYSNAQGWYWVTQVFSAQVPGDAAIDRLNDIPIDQWKQKNADSIPVETGPLLDVVRINTDFGTVSGRLVLTGHPDTPFTVTAVPLPANCHDVAGGSLDSCFRWSTQLNSQSFTFDFLFRKAGPGRSKLWMVVDPESRRLLSDTEAASRVMLLAKPWVGESSTPDVAFSAIVRELENQKLKIPVVDFELPVRFAAIALALFSLTCAYLNAASYSGLGKHFAIAEQKSPWILTYSHNPSAKNRFNVERLLSLVSISTAYVGLWIPAAMSVVAVLLSPDRPTTVAVIIVAIVGIVFLVYSTRILSGLITHLRRA